MGKKEYPYKKGSWNQMIKKDPDFHNKFELNTSMKGPTFIPKTGKSRKQTKPN